VGGVGLRTWETLVAVSVACGTMIRMRYKHSCTALVFLLILVTDVGVLPAAEVKPLEHAHAHNDYEHARPLLDALEHGFTSVEADIYLVDGELLVAHNRGDVKAELTLEALYLAPLSKRVEENGGHVFKRPSRFFLLVDIKSQPQAVYAKLKEILPRYERMLTAVEGGKLREGAVTIVLTGARPEIGLADVGLRYVGLDGHVDELGSPLAAHFMPMVSGKWGDSFVWKGDGEMPAEERAKLQGMVKQAHAAGRVIRFWATPEKESVWRELRAADVDLINTDQLARLRGFLLKAEK
jgi:hypothetical protein